MPAVLPAAAGLAVTADVERIEAPVTWKAYMMCAFASFGGIFFGYDSGYIGAVQGMTFFVHTIDGPNRDATIGIKASEASLIVSILSAGTFFGESAPRDGRMCRVRVQG